MSGIRRREFVILLGCGTVAAWPLAARAAGKRPRVAVLTLLSVHDERGRIAAFVGGMQELGYVAGQTFDIDYRYAAARCGHGLQSRASRLMTWIPRL